MAVNKKEDQIRELLEKSQAVLICLPYHPNTDAIASSLALSSMVQKMGKKAKVVSHRFQLPMNHRFLPKSEDIDSDLPAIKKFILTVSLENAQLEELSYSMEKDKLHVFLTPKDGHFTSKDVSSSDDGYTYDCIITIDAHDLDALGPVYEQNTDFFYSVPIINIDHSAKNDHFGQINLVDINATSVSEILFELLEHWGEKVMDEYMATQLLAGMISKTKSFQAGRVTPRSLAIASHLIDQGARRDEIVKHLYQSKSVNTLKLWGKVLSRLTAHEEFPIVWSFVRNQDFLETDSKRATIHDVIDELIINTPDAKNVCILYEIEGGGGFGAVISTAPFIHAKQLFEDFGPEGTEQFITIPKTELSREDLQKVCVERIAEQYTKTKKTE